MQNNTRNTCRAEPRAAGYCGCHKTLLSVGGSRSVDRSVRQSVDRAVGRSVVPATFPKAYPNIIGIVRKKPHRNSYLSLETNCTARAPLRSPRDSPWLHQLVVHDPPSDVYDRHARQLIPCRRLNLWDTRVIPSRPYISRVRQWWWWWWCTRDRRMCALGGNGDRRGKAARTAHAQLVVKFWSATLHQWHLLRQKQCRSGACESCGVSGPYRVCSTIS